jgi:hypothetical protein
MTGDSRRWSGGCQQHARIAQEPVAGKKNPDAVGFLQRARDVQAFGQLFQLGQGGIESFQFGEGGFDVVAGRVGVLRAVVEVGDAVGGGFGAARECDRYLMGETVLP